MLKNRKNILLVSVMVVLILAALYLYKDDIIGMIGFNEEQPMAIPELASPKKIEKLDNQPQKPIEKLEPEIVVSNEIKIPQVKDNNGFVNLEKVEDYAQSINSMGELSDLRNQAEILKARTELTKEQANFEIEKQNLINLMTPKPLFVPEQKSDDKNKELLEMIKKQQEQIDDMRDKNIIKNEPAEKSVKVEAPILPVDNGVTLLSVQKSGKSYSAVVKDNGIRKIVKSGDKLAGEKISSISKNGIIMASGKKYNF